MAGRLTAAGKTVAVIERKLFGGTCVNTGCTPTKTLIASAAAIHTARRGGDYGFSIDAPVKVDMKRVKARADQVSGNSRNNIEKWLGGMKGCTVIRGHARFTGPKTVEVNGETLTAPLIFINVGGRARIPDMPGVRDVHDARQQLDPRARYAAAAPRRRRRQLRRARIRADVSPLRRRGDGGREIARG